MPDETVPTDGADRPQNPNPNVIAGLVRRVPVGDETVPYNEYDPPAAALPNPLLGGRALSHDETIQLFDEFRSRTVNFVLNWPSSQAGLQASG